MKLLSVTAVAVPALLGEGAFGNGGNIDRLPENFSDCSQRLPISDAVAVCEADLGELS